MQLRFYHRQLLSGHLSDRNRRKIWPVVCHTDGNLQSLHGLWRTRFNFHSDIFWFVCVCMCECVLGGLTCLHILTWFSGFWNLEANHMWLRGTERSGLEKKNKLSCDGTTGGHEMQQNKDEKKDKSKKKGELKLTVCTWCVPEGPWFTHTSCQSAGGFWICGGYLDMVLSGGSHDSLALTRGTLCRWVQKWKHAPRRAADVPQRCRPSAVPLPQPWNHSWGKTSERSLKVQKTQLSAAVRLDWWEIEFSPLNC